MSAIKKHEKVINQCVQSLDDLRKILDKHDLLGQYLGITLQMEDWFEGIKDVISQEIDMDKILKNINAGGNNGSKSKKGTKGSKLRSGSSKTKVSSRAKKKRS